MTLEEEYKLLVSQRQVEQNLMWSRHNFYFFVNGVLLAGFTAMSKPEGVLIKAVITLIGLVTCFFWMGTAKGGLKWTNYYRDLLAEIENEIDVNLKLFHKIQEKYDDFGTARRLPITMRGLAWVFFASWVIILLCGIR